MSIAVQLTTVQYATGRDVGAGENPMHHASQHDMDPTLHKKQFSLQTLLVSICDSCIWPSMPCIGCRLMHAGQKAGCLMRDTCPSIFESTSKRYRRCHCTELTDVPGMSASACEWSNCDVGCMHSRHTHRITRALPRRAWAPV